MYYKYNTMEKEIILKNVKTELSANKNLNNLGEFFTKKLTFYLDVVENITINNDEKIRQEFLSHSETQQGVDVCQDINQRIYKCLSFVEREKRKEDILKEHVNELQEINDSINKAIKNYGCYDLEQVITICYGTDYIHDVVKTTEMVKHNLLKKYFHPTSFKCFSWKNDVLHYKKLEKNKLVEDHSIVEHGETLECFDLTRTSRVHSLKFNGIKVIYQNPLIKRSLIISGYLDNAVVECLNNDYINLVKHNLLKTKCLDFDTKTKSFVKFVSMLSLKDVLIYSVSDLKKNYIGFLNQYDLTKSKIMTQTVNEFMNMDIGGQMRFLKMLLVNSDDLNASHLSSILFGLLIEDNSGIINEELQNKVYYALPHECRKLLKRIHIASKKNNLFLNSKFNLKKLSYEQRISMLNVDDDVKEKATVKLREVNSRTDENGLKARSFLDGLLSIPFGIYREEPVLKTKQHLNSSSKELMKLFERFVKLLKECGHLKYNDTIYNIIGVPSNEHKGGDMSFDILKTLSHKINKKVMELCVSVLKHECETLGRFEIKKVIDDYNQIIKSLRVKVNVNSREKIIIKVPTTGKKKNEMMDAFINVFVSNINSITTLKNKENNGETGIDNYIIRELLSIVPFSKDIHNSIIELFKGINEYKNSMMTVDKLRNESINSVDECVYGHKQAKKQIKNIINQWITGENSGYCFGFEGPPGIGKTSMAKDGLSKCLYDEDGVPRPFEFIALGGNSSVSYLNGHSYTYLSATWGRFVDILMNKKCMNPIIFIDELDKVSNSEQGKEVIGLLTHLIDSTQNTMYQDKYFSGINIDLSKTLIIFSYNDPSLIDPILRDRIHRIKFDKLTPIDKLVVCKKYLIPEMNTKFGFSNDFITISDETIMFLIDNYTCESGVRKLKQLCFELWGDINEMLLNNNLKNDTYEITSEKIEHEFLRETLKILRTHISNAPCVGTINGLWANALGMGGIIPIQIKWFPTKTPMELKLTGMQGDVMKESMNVSKTIAWSLLTEEEQQKVWKYACGNVETGVSGKNNEMNPSYGLHIHCPDGAVNKDGPSAGGAITVCLISFFKGLPISNLFGMTGEINLSGEITAIGGLEQKFYYGIMAGVRKFAYPYDNDKDFQLFREKYSDKITGFDTVQFHCVNNINDVCNLIFENVV